MAAGVSPAEGGILPPGTAVRVYQDARISNANGRFERFIRRAGRTGSTAGEDARRYYRKRPAEFSNSLCEKPSAWFVLVVVLVLDFTRVFEEEDEDENEEDNATRFVIRGSIRRINHAGFVSARRIGIARNRTPVA